VVFFKCRREIFIDPPCFMPYKEIAFAALPGISQLFNQIFQSLSFFYSQISELVRIIQLLTN
jgi:hypothetical protein